MFPDKLIPLFHISGEALQTHQIRIIGNAYIRLMLLQHLLRFRKGILDIDIHDLITGRIHSLEITILTVIQAPRGKARIIKIFLFKIMTNRCSGKEFRVSVFRQDQPIFIGRWMIKNILIMIDIFYFRTAVFFTDFFRQNMIADILFDIKNIRFSRFPFSYRRRTYDEFSGQKPVSQLLQSLYSLLFIPCRKLPVLPHSKQYFFDIYTG